MKTGPSFDGRISPSGAISSGAASVNVANDCISSATRPAAEYVRAPARTFPTGCKRYSKLVATPKFPPPPRIAQKRSGLLSGLASTCPPSAVTARADIRLSHPAPYIDIRMPSPPPSVNPASPTFGQPPAVVAIERLHRLIQVAEQRASLCTSHALAPINL